MLLFKIDILEAKLAYSFSFDDLSVSPTKVLLKQLLFFLSGRKLGYTFDNKNFHNVSLGQGQEVIAEQALNLAAKNGHWVILQVQQIYF